MSVVEGFVARWTSELRPDTLAGYRSELTYRSSYGSLSDGWTEDYPMNVARTWVIAPRVGLPLLLVFMSVSLPGPSDTLEAEACKDISCREIEESYSIETDYTTIQASFGIVRVKLHTGSRDSGKSHQCLPAAMSTCIYGCMHLFLLFEDSYLYAPQL